MDVIEQWLADNCQCHPQFGQAMQELYKNYVGYLDNEFPHASAPSKRKFGDALSERGFEPVRGTGGGRLRKGLMLKDWGNENGSRASDASDASKAFSRHFL